MAQELATRDIIKILQDGGVGVLPTDTLYGLSASVFKPEAVEKIYKLKNKDPQKPLIILISTVEDLAKLVITLNENQQKVLAKVWPGPVSVVLPCASNHLPHLHRGTNTLACRLPTNPDLINLLKQVGPLISTSANPTGELPASTIAAAKNYFGDQVDFYLDGGTLSGAPSTLISLVNNKAEILRQGVTLINF